MKPDKNSTKGTPMVRTHGRREATSEGKILNMYMEEVGKTALLTLKQEQTLTVRKEGGDEKAREHLIKANLRLVINIAERYRGYGLPFLDLISEGNIGLMRGIDKFKPDKGAKISTYISWWIRQAIIRALTDKGRLIRLPGFMVRHINKIRKIIRRYEEEYHREPTSEKIGEELDMTSSKVEHLRSCEIYPISLHQKVSDGNEDTLNEIIADPNALTASDILETKTRYTMLHELIDTLNEREATILRYHFGLDGHEELTLKEISKKFGLGPERIRQLEVLALNTLKQRIRKHEEIHSVV